MIPTILHIGPFPVHSFGLLMVFAFLSSWRLLALCLDRGGENAELAEPMVTWAALGGILGARFGYLLTLEEGFWSHPLSSLFGGAGFVFHWGFIGGAASVWFLLRRHGRPFLRFADLTAPSLALGYAIGRIGCQLSGDGDYGKPTTLPWAMGYPAGVVPTPAGVLVHPAPVYETLIALLIAGLLVRMLNNKRPFATGIVFGSYLLLSGVERFAVEFVRIEPIIYFFLTQAQLVSTGLIAVGLLLIFVSAKRGNSFYSLDASGS